MFVGRIFTKEDLMELPDDVVIANLVNVDAQAEVRYPWDDDFQRVLLGTMLSDRYFTFQSAGLIKPTYFKSEIHQAICRHLYKHFDEYKQLPSRIFIKQVISDHLKARYVNQPDACETMKTLYNKELSLVYDYFSRGGVGNMLPCLDSPDALLDKIAAFAKTQAMKQAFHRSLEIIRKNSEADETWVKVDEIINEARLVNRKFDEGLNYFATLEERYTRMQMEKENAEIFTTGFQTLDRSLQGGGLTHGEMGAWMGLPGQGKSLALTWAAVQNIARGKKVLYVSTEMDPDRIAQRFDAQMAAVGLNDLMSRKEEVWQSLREVVHDYEDKRRLVIKQFPSGSADVNTIRAYYAQLSMLGFKPDMMIVDYPGDMKHYSGLSLWDSRYRMLTELRGFGVEEQHCTLIAIQPNKAAAELSLEEFLDESKIADAFSQNRVLDALWTLNQTTHEHKAAVGRVFVAKARSGKSKFSFKISYGFKDQTLRLFEISDEVYHSTMSRVREKDSDDVAIDTVNVQPKKKGGFKPSDGETM